MDSMTLKSLVQLKGESLYAGLAEANSPTPELLC